MGAGTVIRTPGPKRPASGIVNVYAGDLDLVSRIWYGWTSLENADAYEWLLEYEVLPGIQDRRIRGYRGIDFMRRDLEHEVEFVTIMWFDSMDSVRVFAGEDFEQAVVPPKARALLSRFDADSKHYNVVVAMEL